MNDEERKKKHAEQQKRYADRNRERVRKSIGEWYRKKHVRLEKLFGSVCFCCRRNDGRRMEFHHLSYNDGEPRGSGQILKQVEANPERFRLLCNRCHYAVTTLMREPRASNILEVVRLSGGAKTNDSDTK